MKKSPALVIGVLIALISLFCGCSAYMGIRDAFEKEGYEVSKETEEYASLIEEMIGDDENVTVHVFRKNLSYAVVAEFASNEALEDAVKESEALQGLISDLKRSEYVSGNCVLLAYAPLSDAPTIFKNTK